MKKQTIITLTAIVAILVAGIFAGCVEKEAPTPIDNQAFKNNCADAFDSSADQLEKVELALDNYDVQRAKLELATFETMIDIHIDDIKQTTVSEEAIPFKTQMLAFFDEMKLAATHCDKYLDTGDDSDLMLFYEHIANAMAHGSIAVQIAEDL